MSDVHTAVEIESLRAWREERGAADERDESLVVMGEAVRDWLAWIYEAGPEPGAALGRLVSATAALAPWLTAGLAAREATLARTLAVAPGAAVPPGVDAAGARAALAAAYRREGRTWAAGPGTALDAMLAGEAARDAGEQALRTRGLHAWLARVWDGGAALGPALKALYVEARALAPELLLNMTGGEIAAIFGQGRAAESARVRARVNDFLRAAGCRHTTLRFQKTEASCARYAAAQRGNRNRAKRRAA